VVHAVIPHLVGTVTLITIFFTVVVYYQYVYASYQTQLIASNLKDVADYVASNIVDLVSLCYLSHGDQNLNITIKIPTRIGNDIYTIRIFSFSDPNAEENLYIVRAYLTSNPSTYGQAELPWSSSEYVSVDPAASSVSSSIGYLVIWCRKTDENIVIGFAEGGG